MNRIIKYTILSLIVLGVTAFVFPLSDSAYAANVGRNGEGHDQDAGGGGDSSTHSCRNNSCNSVVYSGAQGWEQIPVTQPNQPIHVPSLDYGGIHYNPGSMSTGNAAVGSTFYVHAIYAATNGYVTLDGVRTYVTQGQLLTYIPIAGLPKSNGTFDKAFAVSWLGGYPKPGYGTISEGEIKAIYDMMVANGMLENLSLLDLLRGFGGLQLPGMTEEEIEELLGEFLPPTPPKEPLPGCVNQGGSHYGWTEGHVKVKNMTKNENFFEGTTWARPGDSVQFKVEYCWGVGAVGGSLDNPTSPWAIPPNGAARTTFGTVSEVWFTITANKGEKYLFGAEEEKISGGLNDKKNTLTDPHKSNIGSTGVDFTDEDVANTGSYAFVSLSPSKKAEDQAKYNCMIFDFQPGWVDFGYQIPGVATGSCSAITNNGGNMSDVGGSITQTIKYNYATAWQLWKHTESGSCHEGTCTHSPATPTANIVSTRTYEDNELNDLTEQNVNMDPGGFSSMNAAISGAGYWGLINKHRSDTSSHEHDCDQNGTCGCSGWTKWVPCYTEDEEGNCVGQTIICNGTSEPDCSCIGANGKQFKKPKYDYTTGMNDLGEKSSSSTVNIPYSYRTDATAKINDDLLYLGDSVSSNFEVKILPRVVTEVRPSEPYATILDGEIRAVEFVISADSGRDVAGSSTAYTDPCSYFSGKLSVISGCNTIWSESGGLNPEGRYDGKEYYDVEDRAVPDLEKYPVGSKYCVAVGISHSDSHGQPDTEVVSGMSSPSSWRVSNAACATIVKKPNFQVWNGAFYANGKIDTSLSTKRVGADLGAFSGYNNVFGSWNEYYVVANKDVSGFGSGAAFGYSDNTSLGLPGGFGSGSYNKCDYSKMTIANSECSDNGRVGNANINIGTNMDTMINRLYSRYTDDTSGDIVKTLSNGAVYVHHEGGQLRTSEIQNFSNARSATLNGNTEFTGQYIKKYKSEIISSSQQSTSNYANNTLVIHVEGDLIIDTNICTGSGSCINNPSTWVLGERNNEYYTSIYSVPQILILVTGNIIVEDNVDQIDAWLIADGYLDTCDQFAVGSSDSNTCTEPLVINGPVSVDKLYLNRSAGANPSATSSVPYGRREPGGVLDQNIANDSSVSPGEIFNIRPDTLFWAYSQAQKYSQANVTYTRELAPRF